jgi:NAD(P)-dependent dehydrogenase (short-subunit alcohol dehydrogenase family)
MLATYAALALALALCLAALAAIILTRRLERAEEAFISACLARLTAASRSRPRAVVVTGATSGIGEHLALLLAGCGAHVYLCHRDADRGAATAARIRALHPAARLALLPLDVTSPASVRAAAALLRAAEPCLEAVVCNAGVMPVARLRWGALARALGCCQLRAFLETGRPGPRSAHFMEGGASGSQLATHVLGHLLLLRELRGALVPGRSRVVWSGSRAAEDAAVDWAHLTRGRLHQRPAALPLEAYAEAKALLELASRALAARTGLASLVVCPGFVETPIAPPFFAAMSPLFRHARALAPSMTLALRRGCGAHLGALAAQEGQLSPGEKYVLCGGGLAATGAGRVGRGMEGEAWRVCEEWMGREEAWGEGGGGGASVAGAAAAAAGGGAAEAGGAAAPAAAPAPAAAASGVGVSRRGAGKAAGGAGLRRPASRSRA